MCGVVGFSDKTGGLQDSAGRIVLAMLQALACRGPDGAGVAMIGAGGLPLVSGDWAIRIAIDARTMLRRSSDWRDWAGLFDWPMARAGSGRRVCCCFDLLARRRRRRPRSSELYGAVVAGWRSLAWGEGSTW